MEIGLTQLPSEVRATLSEPEPVIRSWSHGNQKLAATSERVFIQEGRWSRKTIEIPYSSIGAIEHVRRYDWQTLVIGAGLSLLLFIQHYLFPIISSTVTSGIVVFLTDFFPTIKMELSQIRASIWLAPISIASLIFLIRARKGYILRRNAKPDISTTFIQRSDPVYSSKPRPIPLH